MALKSLTGKNPKPSAQKSSVLTLHQCKNALIAAAKAQGLTPVVYEDGVLDAVDYSVHLTPGRASFHVWYDTITLDGKTYPKAAAAVDFNITPAGKELAFITGTAVGICKRYGIAYYIENRGANGQHLHIDVGSYSNDGSRWVASSWIGTNTVKASTTSTTSKASGYPLPSGHYYGVNDGTAYSHSGVRGGTDDDNVRRIQAVVGVTKDGIYGSKTKAAVVAWQKKHNLSADGKVGQSTYKAMGL